MRSVLCDLSQVAEGEIREVRLGERVFMVFRYQGHIHVYDAFCTHRRCNLARMGKLDEGKIVCTCHDSEFDAETGKPLSGPARKPLTKYRSQVEGDKVFLVE
jgi:3-phenylpropionate/trans-cinnamate dioxygenase ferredoxin subunit